MATKMVKDFASTNEIPKELRDSIKGKKRLDKRIYTMFVEYIDSLGDPELTKLRNGIVREGKLDITMPGPLASSVPSVSSAPSESAISPIDIAISDAVIEAVADVVEDTIEGKGVKDIRSMIENLVENTVKDNIQSYVDSHVQKYVENMLTKKLTEMDRPMEARVKHLSTVLEMMNKEELNPTDKKATAPSDKTRTGIDRFTMRFRKP